MKSYHDCFGCISHDSLPQLTGGKLIIYRNDRQNSLFCFSHATFRTSFLRKAGILKVSIYKLVPYSKDP